MIDERLVVLVNETKTALAGMTDARPSEILAVREKFGADLLALVKQATADITPEQKIAAFDSLAESHVAELVETVQNALKGQGYYKDDDTVHYTWGAVQSAVLGSKAPTHEFEALLPRRNRR